MFFEKRILFKIIGVIFSILAVALIPSVAVNIYYNENISSAFLLPMLLSTMIASVLLYFGKKLKGRLKSRYAYGYIMLAFVICVCIGAIPYFVTNGTSTVIDGIFESVAGFTTTNASLSLDRFQLKSIVFWKASCHWLGGVGILLFVISIIPSLPVLGERLITSEASGPIANKATSNIREAAKKILLIYIAFTIACFALLVFSPTGFFDAAVLTLDTVSSSGSMLHADGILYYKSFYVELVISIFSILATINFLLYISILNKKHKKILRSTELKVYLIIIILLASIVVAASLYLSKTISTVGLAFREGFFQVVSFASTSGHVASDYRAWPSLAIVILALLLFVGGCGVSTSGSMKVIRIILMAKMILRGFYKRVHPRAIKTITLGDLVVSSPIVTASTAFIFLYLATFMVSAFILSFQNLDMETTLSSAASLLSTTGNAFGEVGASGNFACFTNPFLRLYMSILMILGRFEILLVLLIFLPGFWNPNRRKND
ncbi:MAG: TrkH family potassium uptake protein [Anaerovoracaceae bacterium]